MGCFAEKDVLWASPGLVLARAAHLDGMLNHQQRAVQLKILTGL